MRILPALPLVLALASLGCNDIPEGAVVGIQPELPTTSDDLSAVLLTPASDKHPLTYRYAWSVDGTPMPELTTDIVPAAQTSKGQVWSVVVTPNDGKVDGVSAEASITIMNTAPTATVSIEPADPRTGDDLSATAEGLDEDGDAVILDWEWARDGVKVQGDRPTIPSRDTAKGQVWEVTVTPTDGETEGTPVSASVTIGNEAPLAESVSLSPEQVFADTTLTASAVGSDPDEDSLTWTYAWYVSGGEVASGPGDSLAGEFRKGDEVFVEAVASDGTASSTAVQSSPVTVLNTPPALGSVTIDPAEPKGDAVLTCTASGATDLDGDPVTVSVQWVVNGRVVKDGGALDNTRFRRGDLVVCRATPSDGEDDGDPVESASVEIGNSPPSIGSVSISPSSALTADALSVSVTGATDPDGDTISFSYSWKVDGKVASTSATLPAASHAKGNTVEVTVTPTDGTDSGTPASAKTTILNTAPSTPVVAISPSSARVRDSLTCTVSKASVDPDGDRISYTVSWTRNGTAWSGSTSTTTYKGDTIPSSSTKDGETWLCSVSASDGTDTSTPGTSSVTVKDRDGQVRTVSGTWLDVEYVQCGTGSTCTASQAKSACSAKGLKVVSHASNGTTDVKSLGATNSCQWSTSYFTTETTRASGECLVGISNLEWTSCCGTSSWHGQTMKFGSKGSIFGYVASSNSGYVSGYSNSRQTTWGCQSEGTSARNNSCTRMLVACTK